MDTNKETYQTPSVLIFEVKTEGVVCASGGERAAGIGCGQNGTCGDITIGAGITYIYVQKRQSTEKCIGLGNGGSCGLVTIDSSLTRDESPFYLIIYPTAP